jgi:formate-dependent nitrite reductase cytochrome c552 subunit
VRVSLLDGTPLPTGDADVGIVCATCHDPHKTNGNPAQLRNPIASTNDYFMPTNGTFAKLYEPQVGICAQCHNHAGASWTNNACEPHHSAQYNMYLGTIGEPEDGVPFSPAAHPLLITNQCVACHMQTTPFASNGPPAITGHSFKVSTYAVCLSCHGLSESEMAFNVTFWQRETSNTINDVKFGLDFWATNKAPASLMAKYGALAWEYTTPGNLSSAASGVRGPNAAEQLLIPENIRKARFNLYMVQNEGSLGVHNPPHTSDLLNAAEDWIEQELNQ